LRRKSEPGKRAQRNFHTICNVLVYAKIPVLIKRLKAKWDRHDKTPSEEIR
jgi:hypothetical protein